MHINNVFTNLNIGRYYIPAEFRFIVLAFEPTRN